MSDPVSASSVPQINANLAALEHHAAGLRHGGKRFATITSNVHTTWQGLAGSYNAPEVHTLLAATHPVRHVGHDINQATSNVANALEEYAATVRPIKQRLAQLKAQAAQLDADADAANHSVPSGGQLVGDVARSAVTGALPNLIGAVKNTVEHGTAWSWNDDTALVARNHAIHAQIKAEMAAWIAAQEKCANKIRVAAGLQAGPSVTVQSATTQLNKLDAAGQLPWGTDVTATPSMWDMLKGDVKGLGISTKNNTVGLAVALENLMPWDHDHKAAWTSLWDLSLWSGKALPTIDSSGHWTSSGSWLTMLSGVLALDAWKKNDPSAGGQTAGNLLFLVFGGKGLSKLGDAAKATKAATVVGDLAQGTRAARALDTLVTTRLKAITALKSTTTSLGDKLTQSMDRLTGSLGRLGPDIALPGGGKLSDLGQINSVADHTARGHIAPSIADHTTGVGDHQATAGGHAGTAAEHPAGHDVGGGEAGHASTDGSSGAGGEHAWRPSMPYRPWNELTPDQRALLGQHEIGAGGRTFASDHDASVYGDNDWNRTAEHLPIPGKRGLYDYSTENPTDLPPPEKRAEFGYPADGGSGHPTYKEINGHLRTGAHATPDVLRDIREIDKALARKPTSEPLVVTRGTGVGHFGVSDLRKLVGRDVADKAYTSVSLGSPADGFKGAPAIIHAVVPKDTPAIWMAKVGHYGGGERELLLERGLTLHVDRVVRMDGQWQIYGHYVRPEA